MRTHKTYRPAWREMGWWKWLSVLLVSYSLVLVVPYILFGGGSHEMRGAERTGALGECGYAIGVERTETAVRVTARLDPICALTIEEPVIELLNATGDIVASAPLRGNPNALTARLRLDADNEQLATQISLKSKSIDGSVDIKTWQLSELTPDT